MREIKFRDVEKSKSDGTLRLYYYSLASLWGEDSWQGHLPFIVIATSQYTGLLDKNGTEVYEGDIVSGVWYEMERAMEYKFKDVVVFENGCFGCKDADFPLYVYDNLTVLGNIYENGELLEA